MAASCTELCFYGCVITVHERRSRSVCVIGDFIFGFDLYCVYGWSYYLCRDIRVTSTQKLTAADITGSSALLRLALRALQSSSRSGSPAPSRQRDLTKKVAGAVRQSGRQQPQANSREIILGRDCFLSSCFQRPEEAVSFVVSPIATRRALRNGNLDIQQDQDNWAGHDMVQINS